MHKFFKKSPVRTVAAVAIAGLALSLAACSGGGSTGGDAGSATSGSVNWWGWTPELSVAPQYIEAFNKEFPDIKVTYKQLTIDGYEAALRPALASSAGPDVFDIAPGAQFEQFNHFATDLTPDVKKALGDDWASQLAPIGVDGLTADKKLKAVSVGSTFAGPVWINKGLFDKYNLTPPKNFDEWAKVCETFTANGVQCFVQGAQQVAFDQDTFQAISDTIEPGLYTKAVDGDTKWTDDKIVQALSSWKQLFTDKIMQDGALGVAQYPDANNAFMSGKSAMVMMGTWYMQYTRTAVMNPAIQAAGVATPEPFTILPIDFPAATSSGTPGAMFGDSDFGLAVNAKSKVKNAATTFAVWLGTSKEGQQVVGNALNQIPALNGVKADYAAAGLVDQAVQQPAVDALIAKAGTVKENRLLPNADLATAIGVALTTIASGDASPADAAKTLQASAEKAGVTFK